MIEFKQNSTLHIPEAGDACGQWIIGVGSSGVNILDQLVLENEGSRDLLVIDTDEAAIRGSVVVDKYLIGQQIIRGMGAGGDPELGRQLFQADISKIRELLKGTRLAVIVAGLGGGTASGILPDLVDVFKELGAATVVVTAMPFAFEGKRRKQQAELTLEKLRKSSDAVLCFCNQNIVKPLEEPLDLRVSFTQMNSLLAKVALTLRHSMTQRGLTHLNLADIRQLAHDQSVDGSEQLLCRAAFARAEGDYRVEEVVEHVLASPLLQDERLWVRSHTLMASVTGGADMSMSELQSVIETLKKQLPVEIPIITAAQVNQSKRHYLELTLILSGDMVEFEQCDVVRKIEKEQGSLILAEVPEEEVMHQQVTEAEPQFEAFAAIWDSTKPVRTEKYFSRQEELPLDKKIPRGRFEKSAPTMWKDQDLDQPTFMRKGIKVKI
ncbi:MAG: cell division protein FtsZ [Blastochloris sp.]|nr:cell division protein FtsZ [Blastochloris sp.]